jgi:hypothetical protein
VLELEENQERVEVAKGKPYKRVDDYVAHLKYDLERKDWPKVRKGDKLGFAGDTYKVVDIKADEVVLSADSSGKRTTVKLKSAAEAGEANK